MLHRGRVTPALWKLQQTNFPKPGQTNPSLFANCFLSLQDRTRFTSFDPIKSLLKTTAEATSQFTCLRVSSSAKVSFWDAAKQKFFCLVDTEAERQQESEDAQSHTTQLPEGWTEMGKVVKLTQNTPLHLHKGRKVFLRSGCHLHTTLQAPRYNTPSASLLQAHQVICKAPGISRRWMKHCWRHWRIGPLKPVCQMLLQILCFGTPLFLAEQLLKDECTFEIITC